MTNCVLFCNTPATAVYCSYQFLSITVMVHEVFFQSPMIVSSLLRLQEMVTTIVI